MCLTVMLSLRQGIKEPEGMVVAEDRELSNHDDLDVDRAQV